MTDVSRRYEGMTDQVSRVENGVIDIETKKELDYELSKFDSQIRVAAANVDGTKHEVGKIRQLNKELEKKIETGESELKALNNKVGSLKVKLGLANANYNTCNDEKENIRTTLNEAEVQAARLEERLTASASELDRLRDPANADSNMSLKKYVINDKKEKKRLKVELQNESTLLQNDNEVVKTKDDDVKKLEKELKDLKDMLSVCVKERDEERATEDEEIVRRNELALQIKEIKEDQKTYDKQLKDAKVKLGICMSAQNVHVKLADEITKRIADLKRQLNQTEKKYKDVTSQLDVLKNQYKLTKTAKSINDYTRRNQMSKGIKNFSVAQTGTGPVKFAPSKSTPAEQPKVQGNSRASSNPERSKHTVNGSLPQRPNPNRRPGSATTRKSDSKVKDMRQKHGGQNTGASQNGPTQAGSNPAVSKDKRNSVLFVPPPKAKLKQTTPR